MLEFGAQCCDAECYLLLGQQCALESHCHDSLRPMGVVLWFAWPLALGLRQEIPIVAHAGLLLLSGIPGVQAARQWLLRLMPGMKGDEISAGVQKSVAG